MKKAKNLFMALTMITSIALTLWGCKKEDDDPVDDNNPTTGKKCVMTSYRLEFFGPPLDPWFEAYTRDAGDKLIKAERFTYPDSFFSDRSTITYLSNGNINKVINDVIIDSFAYSGTEISKVFVITTSPRSILYEYNFEYSDGKLQKVIRRKGKTRQEIDEFRLEWSSDNVTKVSTTDSLGSDYGYVTYSDYDNNNNPMRDYIIGFYTNIRTDVPVFTYLSKNNYGKYTTSASTGRWDIRKIVANSDKYPTVIKEYEYRNSTLTRDSAYYHYLYNCK